ncbi:MAG: two component transcriptional regulator, LuxR family [Frankiales bacterium]|nr:two component transcriptional regulator, LuxR family [Frankiales bacterium]
MTFHPPRLVAGTPTVSISQRQADVLAGICCGLTNRQIGRHLSIAEDTVKTHVKHILRALHARNRAHAAALAMSGQVGIAISNEDEWKWAS